MRLGLGYIKDVPAAEMLRLVCERERNGPFTSLGELAGRIDCRRGSLEQLAWSGACDGLLDTHMDGSLPLGERDRRTALWQLGMAAPAETVGRSVARDGSLAAAQESTQLALPLELPEPPRLRALGRWQRLIADYSTSGVTIGEHALAILRGRLTVPSGAGPVVLATSAQLPRLPSGCQVAVAGLVIARQRPGTAKGTMFLLFEDEFGTVNLIVPKAVYERHRHLARAEPLLLARGSLERAHPEGHRQGVVNVIVRELTALERFLPGGIEEDEGRAAQARVHQLRREDPQLSSGEEQADGAEVGSSMRAVAPPIQSFAAGRRR